MTASLAPLSKPAASGGTCVVFFPHAGGSPRFFRHHADRLSALAPGVRTFGALYPGRDQRPADPSIRTIGQLAAGITADLDAEVGTGNTNFVLVGHSMGAFVAYETARLLQNAGAPQVTLVASGQDSPSLVADRRADPEYAEPPSFTDEELEADVLRQNPAAAEAWAVPELRDFFLPVVRYDYSLLYGYHPSPGTGTPAGRITSVAVIVGEQDEEVDHLQLGRWQEVAERPITRRTAQGSHFYLEAPDHQLVDLITLLLAETTDSQA